MKRPKLPPPTIAAVESGGGETVLIAEPALLAWKWLPRAAPARAVLVGPTGERVRVNEDGTVDEIQPGGHPRAGAASDPANVASKPRAGFQAAFAFERSVR